MLFSKTGDSMLPSEIYNIIINHNKVTEILFPLLKKVQKKEILNIIHIEKQEFNGFPYILVREKYNENRPCQYIARYMSMVLDLSSLCTEANEYYFPFICLPENHPVIAKKYMIENIEVIIAHEVCHIKTILSYVDKNPNYYSDLENYGFNQIKSQEDLEKSLYFEINKRLVIEPPALKLEYELGNNSIPIPILFVVKKLKCESIDEFIKINLYGELNELLEAYKEKFKDIQDEVEVIFKKVIKSIPNEYLGENAFSEITTIYKYVFKKLGAPGF